MNNKVTQERIDSLMAGCTFFHNRLHGTTTVCQVELANGFNLCIGMSACVDPANFDEALGRKYAKEDAIKLAEKKLWELEGYRLACQLRPL